MVVIAKLNFNISWGLGGVTCVFVISDVGMRKNMVFSQNEQQL